MFESLCKRAFPLICVVAIVASAAAPSATKQPATKATAAPIDVRSLSDAKAKYEAARRSATAQYLRELQELKRRFLKAENLDEANAVQQAITEVERTSDERTASESRPHRFVVKAKDDWQQTLPVKKGDVLDIKATGEWCINDQMRSQTTYQPDGLRADGTAEVHGQWAILMARIGFKIYLVGKECRITVPQDGVLEFRSNDFNPTDNDGSLAVSVVQN